MEKKDVFNSYIIMNFFQHILSYPILFFLLLVVCFLSHPPPPHTHTHTHAYIHTHTPHPWSRSFQGYYSSSNSTALLGRCNPGYYCPAQSTTPNEVPCPPRFYRPELGAGSVSDCSLCVAGGYCPEEIGRASCRERVSSPV